MPKRRRPRGPHPELRPENARPLDAERFILAFEQAMLAARRPHRLLHERVSPHVVFTDTQEEIQLTDTPTNRAILTLREYYDDRLEYHSACWRFWAIAEVLKDSRLAPWILAKESERWELHEAVIAVAATAPMNTRGEFLIKPFCAALERWVAEHPGTDEEDPSC